MKLRAFGVLALLCLGWEALAFAQTTAPPFAFPTGSMTTARIGNTATLLFSVGGIHADMALSFITQ